MATKTKKDVPVMEDRVAQSEKDMERYFANCPRVSMRLFKDPEQEEGDQNGYAEAAINGHIFIVKRGVNVEVPTPLYLLFKQAGERFDVE